MQMHLFASLHRCTLRHPVWQEGRIKLGQQNKKKIEKKERKRERRFKSVQSHESGSGGSSLVAPQGRTARSNRAPRLPTSETLMSVIDQLGTGDCEIRGKKNNRSLENFYYRE